MNVRQMPLLFISYTVINIYRQVRATNIRDMIYLASRAILIQKTSSMVSPHEGR